LAINHIRLLQLSVLLISVVNGGSVVTIHYYQGEI